MTDATFLLPPISTEEMPVVVVTVEGDRIVEARVARVGWLAAVLDMAHVDLKIDGNGHASVQTMDDGQ